MEPGLPVMNTCNYILNIVELQNVINSASGLTGTEALAIAVSNLQSMVNFDQKRVYANVLSAYDTGGDITVLNNLSLSNSQILLNGNTITTGGSNFSTTSLVAASFQFTSNIPVVPASVLISINSNGVAQWSQPTQLFSSIASFAISGAGGSQALSGLFSNSEEVRISSGGTYMGVAGPYNLYVSGSISANAYLSHSPIRFLIGSQQREVGRFTDDGRFGIGTQEPASELHVVGSCLADDYLLASGGSGSSIAFPTQRLFAYRATEVGNEQYQLTKQGSSGANQLSLNHLLCLLLESVKDISQRLSALEKKSAP